MANEGGYPPTVNAGDGTREVANFLKSAVDSMAASQAEAARAQAEATRAQVDGNLRLAEMQHASARIAGRNDFVLRLLGVAVFVGVIAGGFFTQRFELVSHALTGAAGLVAGLGIGRMGK